MLRIRKDIDWTLLSIMVIGAFFINNKLFFILSLLYFLSIIFKNHMKFSIPRLVGIRMYLFFILYATAIGFILYNVINVVRDLYYILPTLLWIFIGYNYKNESKNGKEVILKTIIIYGLIISISSFLNFMIVRNFSFEGFRTVFGNHIYDVGLIIPILITKIFFLKEKIFSKRCDLILIALMSIQVILSFGRIAILEPIIATLVIAVLCVHYGNNKSKAMYRVIGVLFILFVFMLLIFYILPTTLTSTFLDKIIGSFSEINSSQKIDSFASSINNWRAYEIQAAQSQFENNNVFVKLFGAGIGKGVQIEYIPTSWISIIENNEIPLLHNGFYTLLPKGGIFAVTSLILVFIENIKKGIQVCHNKYNISFGLILVGISVASIANTWVVLGPIQEGTFIVWGLLVGYLDKNYTLDRKKYE